MDASAPSPAPAGPVRQARSSISTPQIEIVISRFVAVFGLLFAAQSIPSAFAQFPHLHPIWGWLFGAAVFGGILASVVASFLRRYVRAINTYISLAYLAALILWPLSANEPLRVSDDRPWLWLMCTVATSTAAVAFSPWIATVYLFITPIAYGFVRTTPSGGEKGWGSATLDIVYAIILGGVVLIIITMLRQAAASVDAAQANALDRYSHAVRQHATEVERVQVDAIVHDSVLTTLLSAARAYTADTMELATRMARNAMGHLKDAAAASPDDDATVSIRSLAERIVDASGTMSSSFTLSTGMVGDGSVTVQSAEAVYSASVQAMVNSIQHAGEDRTLRRWLVIESERDSIRVDVGDAGAGFDINRVPTERLGLRVSIVERMSNAGGTVEIDSSPGLGTVVRIRWPAPDGLELADAITSQESSQP